VSARVLYRTAAVLLVLFAVGHTLGFREADPAWGIGPVVAAMQSSHFTVQGFTRTYWDFFIGAGFTVGALYLFAAILAWQMGGLTESARASMRLTAWSFTACFAAIGVLSACYLFWIPVVNSGLIAACLGLAAWSSGRDL
jgi:hypothetical protein